MIREWVCRNIVADDVVPREVPEPLASHLKALAQELDRARGAAAQAFDRYSDGPLEKMLHGWLLSREEYYLCRAMGMDFGTARELGLSEFEDYDVYRMLRYEDDKRLTYINVHEVQETLQKETPPEGVTEKIHLRFGSPPEECKRRYLRPEQQEFFLNYLPRVYARFSKE
jgi:hypothetical protein